MTMVLGPHRSRPPSRKRPARIDEQGAKVHGRDPRPQPFRFAPVPESLIMCTHTNQSLPNITLVVPEDLHRRMRAHPEIRWSEVVRRILAQRLGDLERMEAIAKRSTLTARDVDELAHLVNEGLRRRMEKGRKASRR